MKNIRYFFIIYFTLLFFYFNCEKKETSTGPPVIPMPDTTSHDFEWQIDYFGDGGSSRLNDVCIIAENDIWAVGKIYLKDSLGLFKDTYNAAHWNGLKWELIRVPVRDYGSNKTRPYPLRAVFCFNQNDVWFNAGADLIQWNEDEWHHRAFFMTSLNDSTYGPVNKMWGQNNMSFYCVGNNGMIVHYDGLDWQKLDSGTSLDIQDIWGARDPHTGEYTVLAVAGNLHTGYDREILKISETQVEMLSINGIDWPLTGIWFDPCRVYYVVGVGIYSKETLLDTINWNGPGLSATQYTSSAIRGNHINDLFVVGAYGDVLHYNGVSWFSYREYTALSAGSYYEVAVKDDLVCAVGADGGRAVILRGKRIK